MSDTVSMHSFSVDTHLFRELGELLVGRDSTALIELIKNAYDADATEVFVYGEALEQPSRAYIIVRDNGTGMTPELFEKGFLRIASRTKDEGERRSSVFNRRYTGAKGIGRLAAHKLSRLVKIASNPQDKVGQTGVEAFIDWDLVEKFETLEQLASQSDVKAIGVEPIAVRASSKPGTVVRLERLRRRWSVRDKSQFINEVRTFSPPSVLENLPKKFIKETPLIEQIVVRDTSEDRSRFQVHLEGAFASGEDYWQVFANAADLVLEIDASSKPSAVLYKVTPTSKFLQEYPGAKSVKSSVNAENGNLGPRFQARIFVRAGELRTANADRSWVGMSGVRVYMEGFRVLPYGESQNDWLLLDSDYTNRRRRFELPQIPVSLPNQDDADAALTVAPNRNYFGAVFLTQKGAPNLQMLVNREGFVPDPTFDALTRNVRLGIDLAIRVRAAITFPEREREREEREKRQLRSLGDDSSSVVRTRARPSSEIVEEAVTRAQSLASQARQLVASGDYRNAASRIEQAAAEFGSLGGVSSKMISEGSLLRILASVGTQMSQFVHEINGLLGMTAGIESAIAKIQKDAALPANSRSQLATVIRQLGDLRRNLERQASYLVDVITPDSRRRRSRQSLAERFAAGVRLVEAAAARREITIENQIPSDLKSPPMFPAELTTIFSNLLTNAVKAAGDGGKIRAEGQHIDDTVIVRIENTGVAVDLSESERWFRPFESTTTSVDPVLGQGMGLGLTITRTMLEQYGAEILFVKPKRGFASAVQIGFPEL